MMMRVATDNALGGGGGEGGSGYGLRLPVLAGDRAYRHNKSRC